MTCIPGSTAAKVLAAAAVAGVTLALPKAIRSVTSADTGGDCGGPGQSACPPGVRTRLLTRLAGLGYAGPARQDGGSDCGGPGQPRC
ncbi:hypothetical protein P3T29_000977 [Kitasatospora sp. MAP5-34]|nr:hypothetical protein [Kitasatospora sp. MAP5-34]